MYKTACHTVIILQVSNVTPRQYGMQSYTYNHTASHAPHDVYGPVDARKITNYHAFIYIYTVLQANLHAASRTVVWTLYSDIVAHTVPGNRAPYRTSLHVKLSWQKSGTIIAQFALLTTVSMVSHTIRMNVPWLSQILNFSKLFKFGSLHIWLRATRELVVCDTPVFGTYRNSKYSRCILDSSSVFLKPFRPPYVTDDMLLVVPVLPDSWTVSTNRCAWFKSACLKLQNDFIMVTVL